VSAPRKSETQIEVEITDEMIEAGRGALAEYSQREDDPAWIVSAVFSAMWRAMAKSTEEVTDRL
jgi:hypothetical protein